MELGNYFILRCRLDRAINVSEIRAEIRVCMSIRTFYRLIKIIVKRDLFLSEDLFLFYFYR